MEQIHQFDNEGLEKTLNGYGYMHLESELTKKFIEYSKTYPGNFLDLGCAYGVATIPCLKNNTQVYACDIDERHLDILEQRVPEELRSSLHKINKRFPNETSFEEGFFDGILVSHLLSFLTPIEIEIGMGCIHRWLKDEGRLFVINYTPYHKTLKNFIPIYEKKKQNGELWPGYVEGKDKYTDSIYLKKNLPDNFVLLDVDTLAHVASKTGFYIEECNYFGSSTNHVPTPFKLDGREWVGLIAIKR